MPKSDLHHAPLEEVSNNNINTNNDRRHVPKSDHCREEEGDITNTNDRRQRHRPETAGDEKLKRGHHPNIGIVDTNIPPEEDAFWDDYKDDDDSGEDEREIPNAAVATAASNPRRHSRRLSGGPVYDEKVYHDKLEKFFRTSSDEEVDAEEEDEESVSDELDRKPAADSDFSGFETKSNDDSSEDYRLEDDTKESEDEAGVDNSSYGSSDEENEVDGKNEAKSKASKSQRERYDRDTKEQNPNGIVALIQRNKATTAAQRVQGILNGDTEKTDNYTVEYIAEGWKVQGKRQELMAFGKDAAPPGAKNSNETSWFGAVKKKLIEKIRDGETNVVRFTTYEVDDDAADYDLYIVS